MIRILSIFLISLFISFSIGAQEQEELIATIEKKVDRISTDRMGSLYLIDDHHIWKYDDKGKVINEYNSKRYGKIQSVDTSDPYKILVFFEEYAMVLILDNYLSPIGNPTDLNQLGYDKISAVAHSRDGGYWLFDRVQQKVFRLNSKWESKHESIIITQWFGNRMAPTEMIEINDKLYINDPNFGLFVFDHFATFERKINLKGIGQLQVLDNTLYYVKDGEFCLFRIERLARACREGDDDNHIEQARIEKSRFYTYDGLKTRIFKTN